MNIRIIAFIMIISGICLPGSAQFKYGIRGGINSGTVLASESVFPVEPAGSSPAVPDEYEIEYRTGSLGFHIGGVVQYYFENFFVQPELLFSQMKNDIQITFNRWVPEEGGLGYWDSNEERGVQKFRKLDMPLMLGYRVGPLRILAGPMASVMLGTTFDNLDNMSLDQHFTSGYFGYQAGLGLELASLNIDVKYEGALGNFGSGLTVNTHSFEMDQKLSQWILTIGFVLGSE